MPIWVMETPTKITVKKISLLIYDLQSEDSINT